MKNLIVFTLYFLLFPLIGMAQHATIITTTGDSLVVNIMKKESTYFKVRHVNSQDRRHRFLFVKDIAKIIYSNGDVNDYKSSATSEATQSILRLVNVKHPEKEHTFVLQQEIQYKTKANPTDKWKKGIIEQLDSTLIRIDGRYTLLDELSMIKGVPKTRKGKRVKRGKFPFWTSIFPVGTGLLIILGFAISEASFGPLIDLSTGPNPDPPKDNSKIYVYIILATLAVFLMWWIIGLSLNKRKYDLNKKWIPIIEMGTSKDSSETDSDTCPSPYVA